MAVETAQAATPRRVGLVEELVRLARWLGREEPRRHELQRAVEQLHAAVADPAQFNRALLRCAVTVERMYSSSLKRLIKAKVRQLHQIASASA